MPGVQFSGFGFKPLVHLLLGTDALIDVPGLIDQIKHHLIGNGFAVFIDMDVATKDFQRCGPIFGEQGRAREAIEDRLAQDGLHQAVEPAALGAVAFIDEHEQLAVGVAGLVVEFGDVGLKILHTAHAKLVHQGADQPGAGLAEHLQQVGAAAAAMDTLVGAAKNSFDLLVQLISIGDDHYPGVGVGGQDPAGEQHHDDAFAAALGVPDDAALAAAHEGLGGFDAEILMHPGQLFGAGVKEHKIPHQLNQPIFAAEVEQILVQPVEAGVWSAFLPGEEVFGRRASGAVAQAFGIIARQHKLNGGEKPAIEFSLLVRAVLADALTDGDAAALEFQHANRQAIDIEHQIRPPLQGAAQGDFLGDGEVIGLGVGPIDQVDGGGGLIHGGLDLHAIAQQAEDPLVGFVETALAGICGLSQLVEGTADLRCAVALGLQMLREDGRIDKAVVSPFGAVAPIVIAQLCGEEFDHPVLGGPLKAETAHGCGPAGPIGLAAAVAEAGGASAPCKTTRPSCQITT